MRADEFIDDDLNEGWKKNVAGAALALSSVLGASYMGHLMKDNEVAQRPIQQPRGHKPIPKMKFMSTNTTNEKLVRDAALANGITGVELAQFLAQTAKESADFSDMIENGSVNYFKRYDGRNGNNRPGDGYKYRGRGFIHLTGKANYARAGADLGLDLVNKPDLAARPDIAAKVAVWFWKTDVSPRILDAGDTRLATRIVNGGYNGYDERKTNFNKSMKALGLSQIPTKPWNRTPENN